MTVFRIIGLVVEAHSVAHSVAMGAEVHQVVVTVGGAVMVPAGLARHPLRDDIEAEVREVAAQARLGWVA